MDNDFLLAFGLGLIVVSERGAEVLFQLLRHAGSKLRSRDYRIVSQALAHGLGSVIGILER